MNNEICYKESLTLSGSTTGSLKEHYYSPKPIKIITCKKTFLIP